MRDRDPSLLAHFSEPVFIRRIVREVVEMAFHIQSRLN